MNNIELNEKEQITAITYGDTFSLYDEKSFDEFIEPFYIRLEKNNIDKNIFEGKRCLDAGCGGGRGSILMAQCGADKVIGVDFSETNLNSCRERAKQKGFSNLSFEQHSLTDLPFDDESFDIVWCNGVLMHTSDPDKCLQEITRVLKKNGYLWLYVYGSGGVYWSMVDWVRKTLCDVDVKDCIYQLRIMEIPIRRIAEWIDDWFAGYLRRYTNSDVKNRLKELGFENAERLNYGTVYDTSQRRQVADEDEIALMGEGDLRYFCQKTGEPVGNQFRLPDNNGKGSLFTEPEIVLHLIEPLEEISKNLAILESKWGHPIPTYKIIVCGSIHRKVRSLLENEEQFDIQSLSEHLNRVNLLIKENTSE
ncbi:MAG: methyltransferase domain-containing protein [Methanomicrobiaceae archaeon]|nr:methyltransferase domain-containing protein [Methanomicrobiaceae archaeon]